ncbi:MAG: 2OG-Fe(II) oxygenase [Nitrosomonadaceae bacterium]
MSQISELKPGSFIFEKKNALPGDVCAEIIERFELNPDDQYQGRVGQQTAEDTDIKRSTDLVVSDKPHWKDIDRLLFSSLDRALHEFNNLYPFFKGQFKDMGYSVQRTTAGEYYHWHIDGGSHEFSHRQLVAIWYLNNLNGSGGTTEFRYQKIKVKPEAGKLILFPPFWTHEHRGQSLQQGSKYIATTWVVFA